MIPYCKQNSQYHVALTMSKEIDLNPSCVPMCAVLNRYDRLDLIANCRHPFADILRIVL